MPRSRHRLLLTLSAITTLASGQHPDCPLAVSSLIAPQSPPLVIDPNPIRQLLIWEQSANYAPFRQPQEPLQLETTSIEPKLVNIQFPTNPLLSAAARAQFITDEKIQWPLHPLNTASRIPFFGSPPSGALRAYYTASRSLVIGEDLKGPLLSVKTPTNRPHALSGDTQEDKTSLEDDIASSVVRTNYIESMDQKIGTDPELILLKDVLSVSEKSSGNGFVVRDLKPLQDGSYYLPAFSIPYVGRPIAQQNGVEFEEFWKNHYAALLGRAKAKLLLRYGIQMETPNTQNILVQLNTSLQPTSGIVLRDLTDTTLVGPVIKAIHGVNGLKAMESLERKINYFVDQQLSTMTSNSLWRLDEAGPLSISSEGIKSFAIAHDQAFVDELEKALKLGFKNGASLTLRAKGSRLSEVEQKLFSLNGQKALAEYHKELRAKVAAASLTTEPSLKNGER